MLSEKSTRDLVLDGGGKLRLGASTSLEQRHQQISHVLALRRLVYLKGDRICLQHLSHKGELLRACDHFRFQYFRLSCRVRQKTGNLQNQSSAYGGYTTKM